MHVIAYYLYWLLIVITYMYSIYAHNTPNNPWSQPFSSSNTSRHSSNVIVPSMLRSILANASSTSALSSARVYQPKHLIRYQLTRIHLAVVGFRHSVCNHAIEHQFLLRDAATLVSVVHIKHESDSLFC